MISKTTLDHLKTVMSSDQLVDFMFDKLKNAESECKAHGASVAAEVIAAAMNTAEKKHLEALNAAIELCYITADNFKNGDIV